MKPAITINPYVKVALLSLSIWIAAILMNTVFVMCWLHISAGEELSFEMAGFIICFSALFSSPGFLLLLLVSIFNVNNRELFNVLFVTAFLSSVLASVIIAAVLQGGLSSSSIVIFISPVAIALLSVLIHKQFINKISNKQSEQPCTETL